MIIDLSTQKGYNIASAIRGIDLQDWPGLKMLVTARIRALVGVPDDDNVGWVRPNPMSKSAWKNFLGRDLKGLVVFEINKLNDLNNPCNPYDFRAINHWLFHSFAALNELRKILKQEGSNLWLSTTALAEFVDAIDRLVGFNTGDTTYDNALQALDRLYEMEDLAGWRRSNVTTRYKHSRRL